MRIAALDPGGTTGWATYVDENDNVRWERGQLGPGPHHLDLERFLDSNGMTVIIYERFQYQRRELDRGVSLNLDAVEYIGVIKLWAERNIRNVVCQTPAQGKISSGNFWTRQKLETLGLWIPSLVHAMDATGHILHYLTFAMKDSRFLHQLRLAEQESPQ